LKGTPRLNPVVPASSRAGLNKRFMCELMEVNMSFSLMILIATCAVADGNDTAIRPVAAQTEGAQVVSSTGSCGCESHGRCEGWLQSLRKKICGCGAASPCSSPCAQKCDSCAKSSPCQPKCNPCATKCQSPCRQRCESCAKRCEPCAKRCEPCAKRCEPCRQPCAKRCEPCRQPCNPCTSIAQTPACDGQIKPQYTQRVAIADDGSWVVGQLFYIHEDGGTWIVRYAPLGKEDKYGGEVVLAHGVDMSNLREGDLAFVRGEILEQGRASKYVGGPLYRASSVELNERVDE
jgi:hypothetical protein